MFQIVLANVLVTPETAMLHSSFVVWKHRNNGVFPQTHRQTDEYFYYTIGKFDIHNIAYT